MVDHWTRLFLSLTLLACSCCAAQAQEAPTDPSATETPAAAETEDTAPATTPAAPETPAETDPAAQAYAELLGQWNDLDKQLEALEAKFYTISRFERAEVRKEYVALLEKTNTLLPQLRDAGVAAYKAAPNKDPKLVRMLVGIVNNDVRHDRYDSAMEAIQLLLDHDCKDKYLLNLAGITSFCLDDFTAAENYLKSAEEAGSLNAMGRQYLEDAPKAAELWAKEQEIRKAETEADNLPRVRLTTNKGDIVIELFENEAPQTVGNFVHLVDKGFYDGLTFHRVLPGFMAQCGDPDGDGSGGPGYEIYDEYNKPEARHHFRGSLSMANTGEPNTGGSQFFLTFRRTAHLDGRHTVFGRVIEGFDVLPKLQRRDPEDRFRRPEPDKIVKAEVVRKGPGPYEPTKVESAPSSSPSE